MEFPFRCSFEETIKGPADWDSIPCRRFRRFFARSCAKCASKTELHHGEKPAADRRPLNVLDRQRDQVLSQVQLLLHVAQDHASASLFVGDLILFLKNKVEIPDKNFPE